MNVAELSELIASDVAAALASGDPDDALRVLARTAFQLAAEDIGGFGDGDVFVASVEQAIVATAPDGTDEQAERVTRLIATAAVNSAIIAAAPAGSEFQWITKLDDDVRDIHRPLHGEIRAAGDPFLVADVALLYPGQPVGPPEVWINCRCTLLPVPVTAAAEPPAVEACACETAPAEEELVARAFDTAKRKTMAKKGTAMPDGSYPIANAEDLRNAIQAIGRAKNPAAVKRHIRKRARALGLANLIPESWTAAADPPHTGIAMVAKPKNPEALAVEGGLPPDELHATLGFFGKTDDPDLNPTLRDRLEAYLSDQPLNPHAAKVGGVAFMGDDDPQACVLLLESGDLADARTALEKYATPDALHPHFTPHMTLGYGTGMPASHPTDIDLDHTELWWGEERMTAGAAETAAVDANETHDAPGWLTNPRETQRLRNYWTKGAGAAKIAWGSPGDLTRCAKFLSKYVGPQYAWGTCQNLHKTVFGEYNPESRGRHAGGEPDAIIDAIDAAFTAALEDDMEDTIAAPPMEWFQDPGFDAATPLTITSDGRVLGHLAAWETCHVGISGECVTPPHSNTNYAHFRTGEVKTAEGPLIAVGQITMDTGHAGKDDGPQVAVAHYDDTGTGVADVNVGEDEFGIWVAGMMRPGVSEQQTYALRATGALSGDWRRIGGNLELVAALAVNVPGFPVPRVEMAASAAGEPLSLVAAAVVSTDPNAVNADRVAIAVLARLDQREADKARRDRAELLVREVNALRAEALTAAVR